MQSPEYNQIQGYVDGYREGRVYGWVWRPSTPQEALLIEVLVDGELVAESAAWIPRADLSEAGIGDGRHGFDVPVSLDPDRLSDIHVIVRVKDGEALPSALAQGKRNDAGAPLDAGVADFVDSILHRSARKSTRERSQANELPPPASGNAFRAVELRQSADEVVNFIVYRPEDRPAAAVSQGGTRVNRLLARLLRRNQPASREGVSASTFDQLGGNRFERVYSFIAPAFNALLGRLGKVHVARDAVEDVNRIYDSCVARGESCLFLYYALPHQMVLGARCPTMPIMAWDYPDIPSEVWNGDQRHDWKHVLVQTAGAITLSSFAAAAVRNAMGEQFPVRVVPAPVWDRAASPHGKPQIRSPEESTRLEFEGLVFDSLRYALKLCDPPPQPPRREELAAAGGAQVTLKGVIFASVAAPRDGAANWQETLTAFVAAFHDDADATLVLNMTGSEVSDWWWELIDLLSRMPVSLCRVVALQNFPDDQRYAELIAAAHWVVNASRCEAVCLSSLEFMRAGRPAVTPLHTAMMDFINADNALIVRSEEIYDQWPHDARQHITTLSWSIDWLSLRQALREAYRITKYDTARYSSMSNAAMGAVRRHCADAVVLSAFADFFGLGQDDSAEKAKMAVI